MRWPKLRLSRMDPMFQRLIAALLELLGLSSSKTKGIGLALKQERQGSKIEPSNVEPIGRPVPVELPRSGTPSTILELEAGGGAHWATLSSLNSPMPSLAGHVLARGYTA